MHNTLIFVFVVDSDVTFSLTPLKIFSGVKMYFPPFELTFIKLNSFIEHSIEVINMAQIEVLYNSKSCSLLLMIARQINFNLAGHNWICPLQLMAIFKNASHSCYKQCSNP